MYGESHTSRVAPLEDASTYASELAYVCTASTDVTVDADTHGSVKIRTIRVIRVPLTLKPDKH